MDHYAVEHLQGEQPRRVYILAVRIPSYDPLRYGHPQGEHP